MSGIYVPPMTAGEKISFLADMLARDYRCKVTIILDDRHGVSETYDSDYSYIATELLKAKS